MGLEDILSISGKGGLFKLLGSMKNGVIVESLLDGSRIPAYAHHRISALADISIYGEEGEKPLDEVMKLLIKEHNGKRIPYKKWTANELKLDFLKVFPDYDQDRVYVSDIKKVYQWTNLLLDKDLVNLDWANETKSKPSEDQLNPATTG